MPRSLPSEMVFMSMLVHLKAKINELEGAKGKQSAREKTGSEPGLMWMRRSPGPNGFESATKTANLDFSRDSLARKARTFLSPRTRCAGSV